MADLPDHAFRAHETELGYDRSRLLVFLHEDDVIRSLLYFQSKRDCKDHILVEFPHYDSRALELLVFPVSLVSDIASERAPPRLPLMDIILEYLAVYLLFLLIPPVKILFHIQLRDYSFKTARFLQRNIPIGT